jgi:hypothetical protein
VVDGEPRAVSAIRWRGDTEKTLGHTRDRDNRGVAVSDRWIAVVTAWDGPDAQHPLVIRLTLDYNGRTETAVCASPEDAVNQLQRWLEDRVR